jgi:hypothetical protein
MAVPIPRRPSHRLALVRRPGQQSAEDVSRPLRRIGRSASGHIPARRQRAPSKKIRPGGSQSLHIDALVVHDRQTQIEIGKLAFRLGQKRPIVAPQCVAASLIFLQLYAVMSPDFIGHLQTLRWNIVSVNVYIHNCFAGLALFEGELSEPKRKVKMNIVYSNPSDMRGGVIPDHLSLWRQNKKWICLPKLTMVVLVHEWKAKERKSHEHARGRSHSNQ